jgi:serine/threonine protein kinase
MPSASPALQRPEVDGIVLVSIRPSSKEDPWDGAFVTEALRVGEEEPREYQLARQENPLAERRGRRARETGARATQRLHHSTLARTYLAKHTKHPFFLKLPDLRGVENSADACRRVEEATMQFEHEWYLHRSFFSKENDFLPKLCSTQNQWLECKYTLELAKVLPDKPRIPFVATTQLRGRPLREWLAERYPNGFNGLELREWLDIAEKLFYGLEALHRERLAHGFISPDNILVPVSLNTSPFVLDSRGDLRNDEKKQKQCLWFINAAEPQPVMYLPYESTDDEENSPIRRWYDAPENLYYFHDKPSAHWSRFELDQGSDYYSTTDIFSLGVTLAFLATGKEDVVCPFEYAEPSSAARFGWQRVRLKERTRLQAMKVQLFDSLVEAAAARSGEKRPYSLQLYCNCLCQLEVILQCVRARPDRRARSVKHVQIVHRHFKRATVHPQHQRLATVDLGASLPDAHQILGNQICRPLVEVASSYLATAKEGIESLRNNPPSLRVTGSRAVMVDAFSTAMSAVDTTEGSRDACIAMTSSAIWMDDNFGPTSRTSSMLSLLRLRGLRVNWLIVLTDEDLYRTEVQRILGFRKSDDAFVTRVLVNNNKEEWVRGTGFSYLPVAQGEYEDIFRKKQSFIGILKQAELERMEEELRDPRAMPSHAGLDLLIAPDFTSRRGHLAALTFWPEPIRGAELVTTFLKKIKGARRSAAWDRFI